jgi:hypothetical protein
MGRSAASDSRAQHAAMTTLTHTSYRPSGRGNPLELTILGVGWLSIAAALAYIALATPVVERLLLSGRVSPSAGAVGLLELVAVVTVPISLATAGVARLVAAFRLAIRSRADILCRVADLRPLTPAVAGAFRPTGGRTVPEVAVGRFGAVVGHGRGGTAAHSDSPWEMDVEGEWLQLNAPLRGLNLLSGAPRDGSVKSERRFGVKVYAAVVTASWEIDRGSGCAVLRPDEILPFLAAGPAGRAGSPDQVRASA